MLPSRALLLLCHLDNDLFDIILYIYTVVDVDDLSLTWGFFSRYTITNTSGSACQLPGNFNM